MQQEASTKLGFGARKTMSIAQKMYEGIDLGGQMQGLITYMRSDSTRLSDLFVKDTLAYIQDEYGKEYVGKAHTKIKPIRRMPMKPFVLRISKIRLKVSNNI